MGIVRKILLGMLLAAWCLSGSVAHADKRVALVIGISAYQKVAKLPNPVNDATAVAGMLKSAGFDLVESKFNLGAKDMRRTLREFGSMSRDADVAIIYYAGHGIELDGSNYLIPADATLETDADVLDETIQLDRVLFAVEPAKQLRLVILDACRDNPFAKTMKRTLASRSTGRGLAKVEPTSPNTMIAFAAKAGSTASDGDSKNSPFAAALVEHLPKPGLDLRRAFGFVRDDVLKNTGNKQEPYVYGSLGGNDLPLVPAKPATAGPQADPQSAVRRDYELALQLGTREIWDAFLRTYADGFYAELAKGQLKRIGAEEARAAAAEKARLAEQETARLVAEGAKQDEVAKAAAAAKAAEDARIAAERAKQIEQEKAAAAEKARLGEQEKARLAAERARQAGQEKAAGEQVDLTAEKMAEDKKPQLTAVVPAEKQENLAADLPRALQSELRRVGCNASAVDGNWTIASQKALGLFNKHAGMKLDVNAPTAHALDAVKGKSARVCPLICEAGYRSSGDKCVKITCRSGYELNDDGTCDKMVVKRPVAKQDGPTARPERSPQGKTGGELVKQFSNSPTCSNVRASCDRGIVNSHCARSYAECMRTGRWTSNYSNFEGLAKR
jgi:uncharacterized caspase-like protein